MKKTTQSISLIVPVFNEEKTIVEILKRLLKIKSVFEIIVIDDGSTDNSAELVKQFIKKINKNFIIKNGSHQKNISKKSKIQHKHNSSSLLKIQSNKVNKIKRRVYIYIYKYISI